MIDKGRQTGHSHHVFQIFSEIVAIACICMHLQRSKLLEPRKLVWRVSWVLLSASCFFGLFDRFGPLGLWVCCRFVLVYSGPFVPFSSVGASTEEFVYFGAVNHCNASFTQFSSLFRLELRRRLHRLHVSSDVSQDIKVSSVSACLCLFCGLGSLGMTS